MFVSFPLRLVTGGGALGVQDLQNSGISGGRYHQNIRQLSLLQPQGLSVLPLCRSIGELLCAEAKSMEEWQEVKVLMETHSQPSPLEPTVAKFGTSKVKDKDSFVFCHHSQNLLFCEA